ncbi:MAG TPA: hypothetical protein VGR62_18680 [Candidatus Binatia bacterium]|jgi:hypothetical protein|nr:hypothetical protein [Candidatus Binatia bacterium]
MRNILWGALGVLAIGSVASAMDITAPGVTVPSGQTGVLQADLTCPPNTSGISLEHRAKLDLNGHVLQCSVTTHTTERRDVKIKGPGTIRNARIALGPGKVTITDILIEDADGVSILGKGTSVFEEPTYLLLKRVTCDGPAPTHVRAYSVRASYLTVTGATGNGLETSLLTGSHVIATDNGLSGLASFGGKMKLSNLTAANNGCGGVMGGIGTTIRKGTVNNNALADPTCADIYSGDAPKVIQVTCDKSGNLNLPAHDWDVCALD